MKRSNIILIGVAIFLAVVIAIIHIQYSLITRGPYEGFAKRQEMKLNETQIQEVTFIFSNISNISEIKDYCHSNRNGCVYYCRILNVNNSACAEVFPLIKPDKE